MNSMFEEIIMSNSKNAFMSSNQIIESPHLLACKSGWLQKKSSKLIKRWQWRFFTLQDRCLCYYKDQQSTQPRCTINFDQISVDVRVVKSKKLELLIIPLGNKRKFRLRAFTSEELSEWSVILHQHISASEGRFADKMSVSLKQKFWKFPIISNDGFLSSVQTGDLLLFTTKRLVSKVQRGVMRCKFDHVALLIKYSSGNIGLFEATGEDGVSIVIWNDFLKYSYDKLYSKLGYRPLVHNRTPEMLQKLDNFIEESNGKKYKFSTKKVLFTKKQNEHTQKYFFCSELIALAYQHMGLLPLHIPPWKYFPGHFAGDHHLPLLDCKLDQIHKIDLDLK